MLLALTSLAFAAETPLVLVPSSDGFTAVDEAGDEIDAFDFARLVEDQRVLDAYRRENRTRKLISTGAWVGGGVLTYGGFLGLVLGGAFGAAPLALAGGTALGMGAGVLVVGSVNHKRWGDRLDDYDTWWAYPEAARLVEDYNAGLQTDDAPLQIRDDPGGFAAYRGAEKLNTGEFAEQVGDLATLQQWNAVRLTCGTVGWSSLVIGLLISQSFLPPVMTDLLDGGLPDALQASFALGGVGMVLAGPVIVYGSKLLYNDVDRWYLRPDAEDWAERAAAPKKGAQLHLLPTGLAVVW